MTHRLEELAGHTEQWKERSEKEIASMEQRRDKLREDRGRGLEERTRKQERKKEDMAKLRAREEEQRNQVMMEKQRNEQAEMEKLAILYLQEEGRRYIQRVRERAAAKKAKKGKKKGKKKCAPLVSVVFKADCEKCALIIIIFVLCRYVK